MNTGGGVESLQVPELVGKTIVDARIVTEKIGDEQIVLHCSDGTAFRIVAWQNEGYPLEMDVRVDNSGYLFKA